MEVELTNTYNQSLKRMNSTISYVLLKNKNNIPIDVIIGMFVHEMHIKVSKVIGFKIEHK